MKHGLFASLVIAALAADLTARADDCAVVGGRIALRQTGGSSTDPAVVSLQAGAVGYAGSLLAKLQADGSFSDIDYATPPAAAWGVGTHFSRVLTLASAYEIPGQSLYHSPTLLAQIESALTFGTGPSYFCGAASCVTGNWWWWQIGVPQALGPTLILLQGQVPSGTVASLTAKLAYHVGTDAQLMAATGENELWIALGHLFVAVLEDSLSDSAAIVAAVEASAATNPNLFGDGIKPDDSFQFHHGQLYTAGYGAGLASDSMRYLAYTDGTAFALPPDVLTQVVGFVANGSAWCVYDGYYDPAVRGREITRPSAGQATLEVFVPAALASSPEQAQLQAYAKQLVAEQGTGGLDIVTQSEQIAALPVTPAFPSGHRHYPSTDYTVHRRSNSFLSIKMLSTRTRSGELVNGEGLQGARQSDGKMFLVLKGNEYLGGPKGVGVWPAVDWSRLPGITVVQNGKAASTDYGVGTEAFVGGTGDGQNGVSAMVLAPIGTTLTANKSWFFFEGYAVFLANEIKTTDAAPVETIVEQWPLSAPTVPIVADGTTVATGTYSGTLPSTQWMSADGLGYFFPGGTSVSVDVKDQSGDWSGLGVSKGTVSARFLTIALEHGTAPTGATAAYAIAFDGQDMASFAKAPPFTVVQNDATISAVSSQGASGAVFWAPGSVTLDGTTVNSDTPAVVWIASEGSTLTVSVADPAQGSGDLHVAVAGSFTGGTAGDPGITVATSSSGATLTVSRAGGVTHTATLDLLHSTPGADASIPEGGASTPDASTLDGSTPDASTTGPSAGTPASSSGCRCSAAGAESSALGATSALWAVAALVSRRRRRGYLT